MIEATIVDFRGSWGSGIATLVVRVGKKLRNIPCDNGPTVRALASMFPDEKVIEWSDHGVNVAALKGKKIVYCMDDMGLVLGGIAPAEAP